MQISICCIFSKWHSKAMVDRHEITLEQPSSGQFVHGINQIWLKASEGINLRLVEYVN